MRAPGEAQQPDAGAAVSPIDLEASSNGRTADFGSAHEGSNPSASASSSSPSPGGPLRTRPLYPDVLVVALGDLPPRLLPDVAGGLKEALGLGWRAGPSLDRPTYAFNASRGQYHGPAVLRRLSALRASPRQPVLGIVDGDLFLPDDGEFVLCDADRDAGAALVALDRLGEEPAALRRRARVEAVHVIGHVLGLALCGDGRCAMSPSRDPGDLDRRGPLLCTSCRAALGFT
jgi:archaemetzincin